MKMTTYLSLIIEKRKNIHIINYAHVLWATRNDGRLRGSYIARLDAENLQICGSAQAPLLLSLFPYLPSLRKLSFRQLLCFHKIVCKVHSADVELSLSLSESSTFSHPNPLAIVIFMVGLTHSNTYSFSWAKQHKYLEILKR